MYSAKNWLVSQPFDTVLHRTCAVKFLINLNNTVSNKLCLRFNVRINQVKLFAIKYLQLLLRLSCFEIFDIWRYFWFQLIIKNEFLWLTQKCSFICRYGYVRMYVYFVALYLLLSDKHEIVWYVFWRYVTTRNKAACHGNCVLNLNQLYGICNTNSIKFD